MTGKPGGRYLRSARYEAASAADYTPEQVRFMLAMDRARRRLCKPGLTHRQILGVVRALGYRKAS